MAELWKPWAEFDLAKADSILADLKLRQQQFTANKTKFDELSNNLAITRNSYLEDIAKYSKGMYNEFKPIIQSISDYTSTLGRK